MRDVIDRARAPARERAARRRVTTVRFDGRRGVERREQRQLHTSRTKRAHARRRRRLESITCTWLSIRGDIERTYWRSLC